MKHVLRQIGLVALLLAAGIAAAADWRPDVWHHVVEGTPFYTDQSVRYHGAGLMQSDGRAVVLILGAPDQGALITVNLPGTRAEQALHSTLFVPETGELTRRIDGAQLVATPAPKPGTINYSFRIAAEDLAFFMTATEWRLRAGDAAYSISLEGSAQAIGEAIAARGDDATTAAVKPGE